MTMSKTDKYYSIREVAEYVGRSVRTVRGWITTGKLPAVKSATGYSWMISNDDLMKLITMEVAGNANKD